MELRSFLEGSLYLKSELKRRVCTHIRNEKHRSFIVLFIYRIYLTRTSSSRLSYSFIFQKLNIFSFSRISTFCVLLNLFFTHLSIARRTILLQKVKVTLRLEKKTSQIKLHILTAGNTTGSYLYALLQFTKQIATKEIIIINSLSEKHKLYFEDFRHLLVIFFK